MNETDFNLKNINENIEEFVAKEDLNFCKMIVQSYEDDLSVSGSYEKVDSYCMLDEKLNSVDVKSNGDDDFYYGISPSFDSKALINCISEKQFTTPDELENFIRKNRNYFMVRREQKEYLKALAEYIVVVMANNFGVKIIIDRECKERLWKEFANDTVAKTMFDYDKDHEILTIYGCPVKKTLDFFRKNRFLTIDRKENVPIDKVYENDVKLVKGRVFYSGVLLKPKEIEVPESLHENDKIQAIRIKFMRSTYGTVCALDANLTEHPLLVKYKSQIIDMLKFDDKQKKLLYDKINDTLNLGKSNNESQEKLTDLQLTRKICDYVNEYLKKCINVNQIGVSANIVSSDGLMLLGKRNASAIDPGKLYPGVNGNAEVADRRVSFYSNSVYEDYPTIRIGDDRIDFFGEIGREAYGELRQDLSKQEWSCYGIILSGNLPGKEAEDNSTGRYTEPFRRLHFNIIFEHPCNKTFEQIEESSKIAAEAFETKELVGIDIVCANSLTTYLLKRFYNFLVNIVNHKDFVEIIITIVAALTAYNVFELTNLAENGSFTDIETVMPLLLAAIIVLVEAGNGFNAARAWKTKQEKVKGFIVFKNKPYQQIREKLAEEFYNSNKEKIYKFHPAAYVALLTYIENKAYDTFFPNDRR